MPKYVVQPLYFSFINMKSDVSQDMKSILQNLHKSDTKQSNKLNLIKDIGHYPQIYKPFLIVTFLRKLSLKSYGTEINSCLKSTNLTLK